MFSTDDRARVQQHVLALARADERVTGGALTGSGSVGADDRWSDIDLAFGIGEGWDPEAVLEEWTARLRRELGVLHHFDLRAGAAVYRVLLLPECLELDLAVAPEHAFGALAPTFRLVFGTSRTLPEPGPMDVEHLIGLCWHHALHSRAAIARGRPWLAELWISALRDHALELACLRHDLPAAYARGVDRLPAALVASIEGALVRSLDTAELMRARDVAVAAYLDEVHAVRPELAARLDAIRQA